MKFNDLLLGLTIASLLARAYVMKLVGAKFGDKKETQGEGNSDGLAGCRGLSGISPEYIEAYKEAIKVWFSYINYKGDKRSKYYKALRDKAETAEAFLWETPSGGNLPNFNKINRLYYELDITSADEMIDYIFN